MTQCHYKSIRFTAFVCLSVLHNGSIHNIAFKQTHSTRYTLCPYYTQMPPRPTHTHFWHFNLSHYHFFSCELSICLTINLHTLTHTHTHTHTHTRTHTHIHTHAICCSVMRTLSLQPAKLHLSTLSQSAGDWLEWNQKTSCHNITSFNQGSVCRSVHLNSAYAAFKSPRR